MLISKNETFKCNSFIIQMKQLPDLNLQEATGDLQTLHVKNLKVNVLLSYLIQRMSQKRWQ